MVTIFYSYYFSWSRIQFRVIHCIYCFVFFSLLWSGTVPQPFLVFLDFESFKEWRPVMLYGFSQCGFIKYFFIWLDSDYAFKKYPELWEDTFFRLCIFHRNIYRSDMVSFSVYHIRGFVISVCPSIGDVSFDYLVQVSSCKFLHCEIMIVPSLGNK